MTGGKRKRVGGISPSFKRKSVIKSLSRKKKNAAPFSGEKLPVETLKNAHFPWGEGPFRVVIENKKEN